MRPHAPEQDGTQMAEQEYRNSSQELASSCSSGKQTLLEGIEDTGTRVEQATVSTEDYERRKTENEAERDKHLHHSRARVAGKLQDAERKVSELQSALEKTQSELYGHKSKYHGNILDKAGAVDSIMNDLDQANQRAALAEEEISQLKEQLSATKQSLLLADQKAPDTGQDMDVAVRSSLEVELATKDREVSHLLDEMQRLQTSINTFKEISACKISQLEEIVTEKDKIIKELAEKLLKQQDYTDMKRELSILKSLEFGGWQSWAEESGETDSHKEEVTSTQPPEQPTVEKSAVMNTKNVFSGEEATPTSSSVPAAPDHSSPSTPTSSEGIKPISPNKVFPLSPTAHLSSNASASFERLQECLKYNVDRYANDSLNTHTVSRCVRELLSINNIGQRLFAKFVLGLSQGTVSELLSKPKPWDKLTEKGRDSYRKMHAWASDQQCIGLLKALLPRKGKDMSLPLYKQESMATEERIAQILSEAHMVMSGPNKMPNNSNMMLNGHTPSPMDMSPMEYEKHGQEESRGLDAVSNGGDSKKRSPAHSASYQDITNGIRKTLQYNSDLPHAMVAHIYQEELVKFLGKRIKEGFNNAQYEHTQEEIRQALSIYHQELSLLSHVLPPVSTGSFHLCSTGSTNVQSALPNGGGCNVLGCHSCATSGPEINAGSFLCNSQEQKLPCCMPPEHMKHTESAFSPVSSVGESAKNSLKLMSPYMPSSTAILNAPTPILPLSEVTSSDDPSSSASPLQRMQSITNSLLSQSSTPSFTTLPQRPVKAVLPPITQQQFDQYNNLNTEDIVKKVKEQLSQYSISQRLFGESVLGLSQGSVSDLLARPKPWHMLTQKGREPFIRMKIFLEDENAVHKLVASQYKIAPEKLMRMGGYGSANNTLGTPKLSPQTPEPLHQSYRTTPDGRPPNNIPNIHPGSPRSVASEPPVMPLSVQSFPGNMTLSSTASARNNRRGHMRCLPYVQPSVYEMAAVTTDLDTQTITSKIKETLTVHNIGQKLFGEAVLGLSQGSVSELLSKPKPWHMLSIKGREPFIRMQMWLSDPSNVEKLQAIKSERREANKRRRNTEPIDMNQMNYDKSYNFDFHIPSVYPSAKKPRILFSEEQKEALRLAYSLDPYPSTGIIEFLSKELGLSIRTITNWFHNHRMRMKQQSPFGDGGDQPSPGQENSSPAPGFQQGMGSGTGSFDPIKFRVLLNQRLAEMCCKKDNAYPTGMDEMSYLCSAYRNCPPVLQPENDMGTLDLSISSQLRSENENKMNYALQREKFDLISEQSNSENNDDSNLSNNQTCVDNDEPTEQRRSPACEAVHTEYRTKVTTTSNSSNRRKPTAPQWVKPGLGRSPSSDMCNLDDGDQDEDYEEENGDDENDVEAPHTQIINGVCVRQMDDFDLRIPQEETVHIEPAPVLDDLHSVIRRKVTTGVTFSLNRDSPREELDTQKDTAVRNSDEEKAKLEREKNIKRMEKALSEQEESWDVIETDEESDVASGNL